MLLVVSIILSIFNYQVCIYIICTLPAILSIIYADIIMKQNFTGLHCCFFKAKVFAKVHLAAIFTSLISYCTPKTLLLIYRIYYHFISKRNIFEYLHRVYKLYIQYQSSYRKRPQKKNPQSNACIMIISERGPLSSDNHVKYEYGLS